ncbi:protein of unknown function [Candidatus Methylocalor cossyra]|uniref:Uncharacterized protein n=1 Tax=Candidatus Methylocalor cossyra TaxID=3108543 RepID=A0ABM9NLA3_9GAMM
MIVGRVGRGRGAGARCAARPNRVRPEHGLLPQSGGWNRRPSPDSPGPGSFAAPGLGTPSTRLPAVLDYS